MTYKIQGQNLEFHRNNQKKGIDGGWGVVGVDEDDKNVGWVINDELVIMIGETAQDSDIKVVHREK